MVEASQAGGWAQLLRGDRGLIVPNVLLVRRLALDQISSHHTHKTQDGERTKFGCHAYNREMMRRTSANVYFLYDQTFLSTELRKVQTKIHQERNPKEEVLEPWH